MISSEERYSNYQTGIKTLQKHALHTFILFPNINLPHSAPSYLFISLLVFSLHTFDHVVLTFFLLTKFYTLFMPQFKFFLFYKLILKYFSPIFTLSCSHLALWVCLTNFKMNYSSPYERSINIEASLLEFYNFSMSIITGTFLSKSVCMWDRKLEQNINKERKKMKWDFLIM